MWSVLRSQHGSFLSSVGNSERLCIPSRFGSHLPTHTGSVTAEDGRASEQLTAQRIASESRASSQLIEDNCRSTPARAPMTYPVAEGPAACAKDELARTVAGGYVRNILKPGSAEYDCQRRPSATRLRSCLERDGIPATRERPHPLNRTSGVSRIPRRWLQIAAIRTPTPAHVESGVARLRGGGDHASHAARPAPSRVDLPHRDEHAFGQPRRGGGVRRLVVMRGRR